ncbi:MAG: alpha/beta hydrolase [Deinococcota bacterium]
MTAETPQPDNGESYQDDAYRIPVDGAELYVEQVGPRDAPVIYYLHGGPGYNSYSFRDLMDDDLQDYQLIYADQRGAGRSRAEKLASSLDVTVLADDVAAIAEALELPSLTLLAHGFGAQIAVETALQHPELVTRLILVNPWVDMPLLARVMQRHAAFMSGNTEEALPAEDILESDPDPALIVEQAVMWVGGKELLDTLQFPKPSSRLRLEHSDSEALVTMEALGQFYIADDDDSLVDIPLWSLSKQDALSSIRLPVVVLLSQDDKTAYPEQGEVVLQALPNALVSVLEGGHYPWLDDPDTFLTLITEIMQADLAR